MTEPASAELIDEIVLFARWSVLTSDPVAKNKHLGNLNTASERLLSRLAAYDALAAAARIEVDRADRFGCRELRDALTALDEGSTE